MYVPSHRCFDTPFQATNSKSCLGTSCELNLVKVLSTISPISDIKTSLLHSQAEFRLAPSESFTGENIAQIVQQKTGFTCTRVADGEELDLLLPAGISTLEGTWPSGLLDLAYLGRRKIRISYSPKVVGARDLLRHPFFQGSRFSPIALSLTEISGGTETYKSFLLTTLAAILTLPVLIFAYAPGLPHRPILYGSIDLVLATLVQVIVGHGFYIRAYKSLWYSGTIEMDMLIVLSTTTAYLYSVIAFLCQLEGKPLSTEGFFETSTLLVTLIMVGRTAAAYARQKAIECISMESLQEQSALVVDMGDPKKNHENIDSRLLQYGDVFKVLPESRIVTDGIIIEGETEVDESLITGESTFRHKKVGMPVIAGSINHSGTLLVKLSQLPSENTIKMISTMVDEAKSSKAKVQEIADRVAGHLVKIVLGLSAIVFIAWIVHGKTARHQSLSEASINAMTYTISTLIVSCPCAIGLAVPMVLVVAGGVGAKYGLLFKSGQTLEIGRKVNHVIFDKTGTLTQGNPSVVATHYLDQSKHLEAMVAGLTSNSKHPVSCGVGRYLEAKAVEPAPIEHVLSIPGKGVEATYNNFQLRAGSPKWLGVESLPEVYGLLQHGLTLYCVEIEGILVAVYGLQDQLRPDALNTIVELKKRFINVSLVSGDNERAVSAIGLQLGIPKQNIRYSYSPTQKQQYVKDQMAVKNSTVLFCGDGTNDAVALAQASIGLHMNNGSDVAQSAADTVLMNTSLCRIITLIDLSAAFYRRVFFNFGWSFTYNVIAISLAAGAIPNMRIAPAYAGIAELVSVLPVIAIAMQLRCKRF